MNRQNLGISDDLIVLQGAPGNLQFNIGQELLQGMPSLPSRGPYTQEDESASCTTMTLA